MLGRKWTLAQRKKLSESCKGRIPWNKDKKCPQLSGKNNHMYGKSHTDEMKKKISQGNLGKKVSQEARKKMSIARKGLQAGEKHSQAKLKECDVIHIRMIYKNKLATQLQIAKDYGVTQTMIGYIIRRKSWTHI